MKKNSPLHRVRTVPIQFLRRKIQFRRISANHAREPSMVRLVANKRQNRTIDQKSVVDSHAPRRSRPGALVEGRLPTQQEARGYPVVTSLVGIVVS
jgi:hypothetical protein